MRKDSISQESLEKAYLIFSERGHKIEGYDFSHPPTDYSRKTVMEPEHTSKLRDAYNELLPPSARNAEYNALANRDDDIEAQIERLQGAMAMSRRMGNFQMLQNQMKQMDELVKEKERNDARMAVSNLAAAQMDVYDDTMDQDFAELEDIGSRIAQLEEAMKEFMGG